MIWKRWRKENLKRLCKLVESFLGEYWIIKSKISVLESEIQAIEVTGVSALKYDIKVGKTNHIERPAENEAIRIAEKKEKVERELFVLRSRLEMIEKSLESLTDREREVVIRRVIEKMPYFKISDELHISESYAQKLKKSALVKLAKVVTIEGDNNSGKA